jgi:hypothetical protein
VKQEFLHISAAAGSSVMHALLLLLRLSAELAVQHQVSEAS